MSGTIYLEMITDRENISYYTFCLGNRPRPFFINRLCMASNRVWKEDRRGVSFLKNRDISTKDSTLLNDEQMKEFMWVKLKARDIEEYYEK